MNTTPPIQCPQCGQAISGGVKGLCPGCLAMIGFGAEDEVADTVARTGGAAANTARPLVNPAVKYFGDYELLEELARGGMGVVFKARQKSLNRVVAVKMILGGQLATPADVKRFRTEAEAAANLQHPNIVAIHEVGEHEGQHYFSMDLVDGPTLAELVRGGALPAGKAAQYVKAIAEAVQFAHQRGILHRDLKPSNVLVDSQDQVRITDFGLAKVMHGDSDLTCSGDVMGSPAYMAPEQAQAKRQLIGPPSDVYSLGALLYHLLTGRPPFTGETAVEILRQALDEEPLPPSQHNAKIPADLETICLKCLAKRPEQRYATARDLAEELERFLNYEPILAKPASSARQAWNWVQKNPWAIAGAAGALVLLFAGVAFGFYERTRYLDWHLQVGLTPDVSTSDSPALLFFQAFPMVILLLYIARRSFRQGMLPEKRSASRSDAPLIFHAACGLLAVAMGMGAMLLQIKAWAWQMNQPFMLVIEVPGFLCAGLLQWLGFIAVWEAVGIHESSRFREAVGRALEAEASREPSLGHKRRLAGLTLWLCAMGGGLSLITFKWLFVASGAGLLAGVGVFLIAGVLGFCLALAVLRRKRLLTHVCIPAILFGYALAFGSCFQWLSLDGRLVTFSLMAFLLASLGVLLRRRENPDSKPPQFPVKPWKDILGGVAFAVALLVVFQAVENWRGRRVWESTKAELAAKGEVLELSAYLKPAVPDAQNVMAHPYMQKYFIKGSLTWPVNHPRGQAGFFSSATLEFMKTLPREQSSGPSITELAASRASREILVRIQFDRCPLAEVVKQLGQQAGLSVEIEANGFPFSNHVQLRNGRWSYEPTPYTGAFDNVTALQALDSIAQKHHLQADPARWRERGVLTLGTPISLRKAQVWYRQYDADFAQLEEALRRPYSRLAMNTNDIFSSPIPNFVSVRVAAQIYLSRCKIDLLLGEPQTALKHLQTARRLADVALGSEPPTLVGTMIRVATLGMIAEAVEETVRENLWPVEQLEQVQQLGMDVNLAADLSRSLRGGERAAYARGLEQLRQRFSTNPVSLRKGGEHQIKRLIEAAFIWLMYYDGRFYQNAANYTRFMQVRLDALDIQGRSIDVSKLQQPGIRTEDMVAAGFRPYYEFSAIAVPNIAKAIQVTARNQTRANQFQLACALERHRAAKGAYPERLEHLVPDFAAAIPKDVFDGQPLRYRRTGDGKYYLWSIGWNNQDDGGMTALDKDGKSDWGSATGDWVWQGVPK